MFSIEFLNEIRTYEFASYCGYFPPGARILEIGGGTGVQAKMIAESGYGVESIDISNSNYAAEKVYPVTVYDGTTIPFPDASFDVVFSSNVLEHIPHLETFHGEMKRVLKPNGISVHSMPSGAWTFWTIITHYLTIIEQAGILLMNNKRQREQAAEKGEPAPSADRSWLLRRLRMLPSIATHCGKTFVHTLRYNRSRILPNRHGEFGNVLMELYTFSRRAWVQHFRKCGYEVVEARPMGIFYTGYMFFGAKWPLPSREWWVPFLGSACNIYVVRPSRAQADAK